MILSQFKKNLMVFMGLLLMIAFQNCSGTELRKGTKDIVTSSYSPYSPASGANSPGGTNNPGGSTGQLGCKVMNQPDFLQYTKSANAFQVTGIFSTTPVLQAEFNGATCNGVDPSTLPSWADFQDMAEGMEVCTGGSNTATTVLSTELGAVYNPSNNNVHPNGGSFYEFLQVIDKLGNEGIAAGLCL